MERTHRARSASLFAALLFTGLAQAAEHPAQPCDEATLHALGRQLGQPGWAVPGAESNGPVVAAACKPWPDDDKRLAAAEPGEQAAPGERNLHLLVALLDRTSGTLQQHQDSPIGEDAMVELDSSSLWLDTARYRLAPEVRAFGVVVSSVARGASCPDGWGYDALSLYAPDGQQLREVFTTYLNQWFTLRGTSCVSNKPFSLERSQLSLALGSSSHHGFADLVIRARVQREDDGEPSGKPRTVKTTVQYDGKRYPFDEFSTFWQSQPVNQE
ncbi:MAG: hypothetical protein GAK43_01041 [Stenotrophomonas maltophilia]|nr:MAG: hypothetical protein GAK43_01041 [Stenotrophomonas maltophilia]